MYQLETRFARINLGARDGTFFRIKTRSVARTASIEIETSAASAVRDACCSIVVYSRGIALHLSPASNRKVCQMRFIDQIASSEGRIKIPWIIILLVLLEASLLLAVLHIYALRQ